MSSNLSGVSASTSAGQFAVGFAQALDQATSVDPTTGKLEVNSGASDQLAAALNALFMQYGFTQDQATQATQSLTQELTNGDPLSLSAGFDSITSSSVSASGAYGANGTWTANTVTQTELSGSLNISVDATGQLNVSLTSQTVSTAQYTGEVQGTGTAPSSPIVIVDIPSGAGTSGGLALSAGALGASAGTPAFASFSQATQAALQAMENALPNAAQNGGASGSSASSASSPLQESESSSISESALTEAVLVRASASSQTDSSQSQQGGQGGADGQSSGADNAATLAAIESAAKQEADAVLGMLNTVAKKTLLTTQDMQKQLEAILDAARQSSGSNATDASGSANSSGASGAAALADGTSEADAASGAASATTDTGAASGADASDTSDAAGSTTSSSGTSLSVEIGFSLTISLQILDDGGYGSTLYARPDGSLGTFVTQPTYATA
ncbi:hypothetical protein D7S86_10765 [Pararobbsia silviterrae]|uniref:Uncharacterized protein n=1 Tax=Pararobbsia silviterrae TaxID=1792498 RepID=A0A494XYW0_9BURK|nr:hypothetical protein D7S86_10765 [Pararobbsia silviterrae]